MRFLRRYGRRVVACLALSILLFCTVDYGLYPYGAPPPGKTGDRGENGLWLRDSWYFGKYKPNEVPSLALRLRANRIRWAYAHVRFIKKDGRLRFRHRDNARRFLTQLRRGAPDVRTLAWVYVGNERGITGVDLSNPTVRRAMVAEAQWLVTDCGFDGIQWDYEICSDGDPDLLALLRETRAALPAGKTLSISTPLWAPPVPRHFGYGWSDAYFSKIAESCDQIVVMAYDSGLAIPSMYAGFVSDQVTHVVRAASASSNPNCRVLIGVPTYAHGGLSHNARAENLVVALRGVRAGYMRLSLRERTYFAGIAPFADYTTEDGEWETYKRDWLQPGSRKRAPAW